ncbi:M [Maize fine streak virus]|uniref:M protein n=1 Tax=Maize fine streak virus TaxID=209854 RepID=Q6E0X4_9RHAB|nr:M [Maize fine streak nucleorhabdovirus] [Maize fine streak virus]AAT66748.1 M [Maize fine streak nucleorhabdovirus] [Maize fine streak virus]
MAIHPAQLQPYMITYYYKFGITTTESIPINEQKFVSYAIKTAILALNDDDPRLVELKKVGDFDVSSRLLFIQHHGRSLDHPLVSMDKPIVKLEGALSLEYLTAGGTYQPYNTHRALVRMRSGKEGLLQMKWQWADENDEDSTYVSGVIYSDLVNITEEEYETCMQNNIPTFDLLGALREFNLKNKKNRESQYDDKKEDKAEKATTEKRKRQESKPSLYQSFKSVFRPHHDDEDDKPGPSKQLTLRM